VAAALAVAMARLTSLQWLHFTAYGRPLLCTGILSHCVARLTALTRLDLTLVRPFEASAGAAGTAATARLAALARVQKLTLRMPLELRVMCNVAAAVALMPQLKHLALSSAMCEDDEESFVALARRFAQLREVTELDLFLANGLQGRGVPALASELGHLQQLCKLRLPGTPQEGNGVAPEYREVDVALKAAFVSRWRCTWGCNFSRRLAGVSSRCN
jgi:hypothetical protein